MWRAASMKRKIQLTPSKHESRMTREKLYQRLNPHTCYTNQVWSDSQLYTWFQNNFSYNYQEVQKQSHHRHKLINPESVCPYHKKNAKHKSWLTKETFNNLIQFEILKKIHEASVKVLETKTEDKEGNVNFETFFKNE